MSGTLARQGVEHRLVERPRGQPVEGQGGLLRAAGQARPGRSDPEDRRPAQHVEQELPPVSHVAPPGERPGRRPNAASGRGENLSRGASTAPSLRVGGRRRGASRHRPRGPPRAGPPGRRRGPAAPRRRPPRWACRRRPPRRRPGRGGARRGTARRSRRPAAGRRPGRRGDGGHRAGRLEPAHVLHHAGHRDADLEEEAQRPPHVVGGDRLRRGHHHRGAHPELLGQGELHVAGAGRQVDRQHVERAPGHVVEELEERAGGHRGAPGERRVGAPGW